jgi:VWFA-related protein
MPLEPGYRILRLLGTPALGAALLFGAQQPKTDDLPAISVEVELVNVFFTVRNKQGGLVPNLDRDDFIVEEEGRPQTIKYFSRHSDLPLTIGLLVDTSISQGNLIEQEKQASALFFREMMRVRKDQAFLISFDIHVDLLQDLTDSTKLLRAGLEKLRVNAGSGGYGAGPVPSRRQRGTLFYDAVYLAADEVLSRQVGRKAIVLITDGNDFGSQLGLKDAIAAALRADVIVYGILYVDREFYYRAGGVGMVGGFASGSALKKLAEETGGRMFEVSKKKPLKAIYQEIQEELRSQYSIGYTPADIPANPGFRRIRIIPRNKDLKVQARLGYYPKGPRAGE